MRQGIRVRTLMLIVGVVAVMVSVTIPLVELALATARQSEQALKYGYEAARYARLEDRASRALQKSVNKPWEKKARAWFEYYRRLRLKYDRAARYPFMPVAPDPPAPE